MKDEITNVLRLANSVRENVRAKQLFTPYNSILVTLSGGQDSICSLLLLYLLQNQLGLEFEVAPRLTGTSFRQARTKPALPANGAITNRPFIGKITPKIFKSAVNSNLCPTDPDQALFDFEKSTRLFLSRLPELRSGCSRRRKQPNFRAAKARRELAKRSSCLANLVGGRLSTGLSGLDNLVPSGRAELFLRSARRDQFASERGARTPPNGKSGLLWCNHFWQKESFHTMLHVAKINLCFSSTMFFFLPIEGVLSEQNAREWRHKSIQRTCAFYCYECCTQGHTKSDRVETILFNILRGTGIAGFQSLQWKKSFYSFSCQIFYPRLSYSKLNWPQSTGDFCLLCASAKQAKVTLLKLTQGLYKNRGLSKSCFVNLRTEPTFRLPTRCSDRTRHLPQLSTAPAPGFARQQQARFGQSLARPSAEQEAVSKLKVPTGLPYEPRHRLIRQVLFVREAGRRRGRATRTANRPSPAAGSKGRRPQVGAPLPTWLCLAKFSKQYWVLRALLLD
jgi:hypothetical protein